MTDPQSPRNSLSGGECNEAPRRPVADRDREGGAESCRSLDSHAGEKRRAVCVIGAGGHAKVVIRTLQESGYVVEAVFDDCQQKIGTTLLGVPIVGAIEILAERGRVPAIIAIGDNLTRQNISQKLDLEWISVVHPRAFVDSTVQIGRGTVVFAGAVIQPDCVLGQHVIVNTSASIDHDCVIGEFAHVAPGARLAGSVSVGTGALVGCGAAAIMSQTIGRWSTVGAGAVVTSHVPADMVVVGVPARPIRRASCNDGHRDQVHPDHIITEQDMAESSRHQSASHKNEPRSETRRAKVYLSPPHMSPLERELMLDAFDSNWVAPLGPHVEAFEREFALRVGAKYAVALCSGTAALHLALRALGIGAGDVVATSTLTFVASTNAIRYVGANPVFIDSDTRTWNLDPQLLADELDEGARVGQPIKAVVAVDAFGQCADFEPIRKLCNSYDVPLIEDAAEALGATYQNRAAGTWGDVGCYSFNGNKIITTSGGGMLVTDRKEWADHVRHMATQARDPAPHYEHSELGFNYRLSNVLAAIGRGQLQVLEDRVACRLANFEFYRLCLADLPGIDFMPEFNKGRATRWLTCITVEPDKFGASREDIRLALDRENIESRPLWKPMHMQPLYTGCRVRGGAVAEWLFEKGLCLPSGSSLRKEERQAVVDVIRSLAGNSSPTSHAEVVDVRE